ncbi:enolase C-terminal domain-like protein [Enemella evansiae]|uniref:enolase C-terminal domain-like protein n=1 Tax=Enemella evansiae TaxID=2016499 RepID=UPI000B97A581|nr:enolase C-terminal domain-like protein [Enemella evansiae]OYO05548.1 hypothetical protein CGZ97_02180 [Enemella evansiae]
MSAAIETLDLFRVDVTWRTSWALVRVQLDDGTVGWGESSDAHIARIAVDRFSELAADYRGLGFEQAHSRLDAAIAEAAAALGDSAAWPAEPTLLGGIEQAFCDLAAQQAGQSLASYLGGPDTSYAIPLYANINRGLRERTPTEFARLARSAVDNGFTAIKCAPFDFLVGDRRVETGLRLIEAVRAEVGENVDLMMDAHHNLSLAELTAYRQGILDLNLRWIEDVARVENPVEVQQVKEVLDVPQAGGEAATRPDQVVAAIESGALDVFMPDVKHAGGDRVAVALGAIAAEAGLEVSIHNPTGPVGTAHSAAASAAMPTARILEFAFGEVDWRADLLTDPGLESGAYARATTRPGLGVGVSMSTLTEHLGEPVPVGSAHPGSQLWASGQ